MLKFRTMLPDRRANHPTARAPEGEERRETHKSENDPRHTPLGRWLRAYRLDELPQLVHVCRGEMSLVGPRPQQATEVEMYDDHALRRLRVRPGMTGLWQVSGRSDLDWEDAIRLDTYYVENWSLGLDVKIALLTPAYLLSARGAY